MELYRTNEVAQMFGVHANTIRKWVKTNTLHPVKLPGSPHNRFSRGEIKRLRRQMGLPADRVTKLYRVGEVAEMFDVHPNTVRNWVKADILQSVKLPGSRYNRFAAEEVNRLRSDMDLPPVETERTEPVKS